MPKKPEDLTIKILAEMRADARTMHAELVSAIERTHNRIDTLSSRIDAINLRIDLLERRLLATEARLGTQHTEVLGALEKMRAELVGSTERDQAINDIEERLSALEKAGARQ